MTVEQMLEERARRIAKPVSRTDEIDAGIECLTFRLGGERYAMPTSHICRVDRLPPVTRIPGLPEQFLGALSLHGDILPVVNLGHLLDVREAIALKDAFGIVLGRTGPDIVLVAEEIGDLVCVDVTAGDRGLHHALVQRVTGDALIVLDAKELLDDPRLLPDSTYFSQRQEGET